MSEAGNRPIGSQRSIGLWIVLAVITLGLATFVWTYRTHDELEQYGVEGLGGVLGVILFFFFSPITFFMIPNEIRTVYISDGQEPPVSWKWGFWVVLPLIGNVVWFLKVQRLLNEFWGSKGAPAV